MPRTSPAPTSWASWVAGAWSVIYVGLSAGWLLGLGGYPFDPNPAAEGTAVLDQVPQWLGASVLLVLAGVGVVVAAGLVRRTSPTWVWRAAFGLALVLAVVLPDYRVLATVAYLPIILVVGVSGQGDADMWGLFTDWSLLNLVVLTLAGISFAHAGLKRRRSDQDRCLECGLPADPTRRTDPLLARRWGRIATYVAIAVPVIYATTRLAWFVGVPLGLTRATYNGIRDVLPNGAALGTMAIGGAVLTLGLVQHWGEVFPRWIPFLRGKVVPIKLAVVPAILVAMLVTSAGLMFIRLALTSTVSDSFSFMTMQDWSGWLPELLWPVWGVALVVAALAYRARRLRECQHRADLLPTGAP